MPYRQDPDLEFLGKLSSADLDVLVKYLIYDTDRKPRYTEELTSHALYKQFAPEHAKYWQQIAAELQRFGGNTLMNIIRGGQGVLYRNILEDVCDKIDVSYRASKTTGQIEESLLLNILSDALGRMSKEARKEFIQETGLNPDDESASAITGTLRKELATADAASFKLATVIANAVARQVLGSKLTYAASTFFTRGLAVMAGPIGWAITGVWTAFDMAGPAYRVTIPAVIEIARLRRIPESNLCEGGHIGNKTTAKRRVPESAPLDLEKTGFCLLCGREVPLLLKARSRCYEIYECQNCGKEFPVSIKY